MPVLAAVLFALMVTYLPSGAAACTCGPDIDAPEPHAHELERFEHELRGWYEGGVRELLEDPSIHIVDGEIWRVEITDRPFMRGSEVVSHVVEWGVRPTRVWLGTTRDGYRVESSTPYAIMCGTSLPGRIGWHRYLVFIESKDGRFHTLDACHGDFVREALGWGILQNEIARRVSLR